MNIYLSVHNLKRIVYLNVNKQGLPRGRLLLCTFANKRILVVHTSTGNGTPITTTDACIVYAHGTTQVNLSNYVTDSLRKTT